MEPIYTKHVTTLPDQGGEGTSRLLRHLDPAAPAPDALDASEIPSVEQVTACLDDLEVLVARETRANHRLRKEAAARFSPTAVETGGEGGQQQQGASKKIQIIEDSDDDSDDEDEQTAVAAQGRAASAAAECRKPAASRRPGATPCTPCRRSGAPLTGSRASLRRPAARGSRSAGCVSVAWPLPSGPQPTPPSH